MRLTYSLKPKQARSDWALMVCIALILFGHVLLSTRRSYSNIYRKMARYMPNNEGGMAPHVVPLMKRVAE